MTKASPRFTKRDMQIINRALGLYETTGDDDYPDDYDESGEAEQLRKRLDRYWLGDVKRVRSKVWDRLDGDYGSEGLR